MNREILFRGKFQSLLQFAKPINEGQWVYGDLVRKAIFYCNSYNDAIYTNGEAISVDPDTVGEFTGMKDKHGVKIFEGDILRVRDEDSVDVGVVKYNEDFGKYVVVYSQVSGNWFDFEGTDGEFLAAFCSEVIGNIYDNSELLSAK